MGAPDPRVDAYLDGMVPWQRALGSRLRALIHAAEPEVEETIKRTVQPYFVLQGNVAALLTTKDHLDVFLYDPGFDDPAGLVTRPRSKTGATLALYEDDELDAEAFTAIIRQIADRNRRGGWRRLHE